MIHAGLKWRCTWTLFEGTQAILVNTVWHTTVLEYHHHDTVCIIEIFTLVFRKSRVSWSYETWLHLLILLLLQGYQVQ